MCEKEIGPVDQRDQEAYFISVSYDLKAIIPRLEQYVSSGAIAMFTGVSETRAVREWGEGTRQPNRTAEMRLRFLARIAFLLHTPSQPRLPEVWLSSPNPMLEDKLPGILISQSPFDTSSAEDQLGTIVIAAKDFAEFRLSSDI